jgi:ferrochelatase
MTYGAPRDEADLPGYLASVRAGRPAPDELIAEFRRRYALIGGSPLVRITETQATALESVLNQSASEARFRNDARFRVVAGMRHSEPWIADAVAQLARDGADSLIGVALSPQWSDQLMGGYVRAITDARDRFAPSAPLRVAGAWYREPAFLDMLCGRITAALSAMSADVAGTHVLLTAHSLPRRVFEAEPSYVAQLEETATLVAARAALPRERWDRAYQSAGHSREEWLRPDLKDLFPSLAAAGYRTVLVVPIQFVADHLEVLYDLDIAAAAEARDAGLHYRRIEMPNADPAFVSALAAVVSREAGLAPQLAELASIPTR